MDYLGKVQQSLENVIVSKTPLAPLAVPSRTTSEEVGGYDTSGQNSLALFLLLLRLLLFTSTRFLATSLQRFAIFLRYRDRTREPKYMVQSRNKNMSVCMTAYRLSPRRVPQNMVGI